MVKRYRHSIFNKITRFRNWVTNKPNQTFLSSLKYYVNWGFTTITKYNNNNSNNNNNNNIIIIITNNNNNNNVQQQHQQQQHKQHKQTNKQTNKQTTTTTTIIIKNNIYVPFAIIRIYFIIEILLILTEGLPPVNLGIQIGYTYTGVSCSQDTGRQATEHVRQVLDTSQCVQEGACQASATHTCESTKRRRRSSDTMRILIALYSEPLFDGSGFNFEQLAHDNTTGVLTLNISPLVDQLL